jgi:hypothetical protein
MLQMLDNRLLNKEPNFEAIRSVDPMLFARTQQPTTSEDVLPQLQFSLTDEQFIALLTPRRIDGVAPTNLQVRAERTLLVLSGLIKNVTER